LFFTFSPSFPTHSPSSFYTFLFSSRFFSTIVGSFLFFRSLLFSSCFFNISYYMQSSPSVISAIPRSSSRRCAFSRCCCSSSSCRLSICCCRAICCCCASTSASANSGIPAALPAGTSISGDELLSFRLLGGFLII